MAETTTFILGARIPDVPYVVKRWRREHHRTRENDDRRAPRQRRKHVSFIQVA